MAEIRPFKAWRYGPGHQSRIAELASPLFDVISTKQRNQLYKEPLNSIHLCVPKEEDAAEAAKVRFEQWKLAQVLVQDAAPSVYVYYQYFYLPNDPVQYCRKGFVCMVRAYDYRENVILRHENTIPASVDERVQLLATTGLNSSPTHGLYTDPEQRLEVLMDRAMETPVSVLEDYQGVTDALAIINKPAEVAVFVHMLAEKQIILADGHHRYESSVQYRKLAQKQNPSHNGQESYNFHMMYLTNTESKAFRILPTHRLIMNLPPFDQAAMLKKISRFFELKAVDNAEELNEVILGKKWTFGLLIGENAWCMRRSLQAPDDMAWRFPDVVRKLDLTVLHYYFIEQVLGIAGKEQRSSVHLAFERNYIACLAKVQSGQAQMALITNGITIQEVKDVCFSGYTMPQKSTYFYPKVVAGLLFGSVHDD